MEYSNKTVSVDNVPTLFDVSSPDDMTVPLNVAHTVEISFDNMPPLSAGTERANSDDCNQEHEEGHIYVEEDGNVTGCGDDDLGNVQSGTGSVFVCASDVITVTSPELKSTTVDVQHPVQDGQVVVESDSRSAKVWSWMFGEALETVQLSVDSVDTTSQTAFAKMSSAAVAPCTSGAIVVSPTLSLPPNNKPIALSGEPSLIQTSTVPKQPNTSLETDADSVLHVSHQDGSSDQSMINLILTSNSSLNQPVAAINSEGVHHYNVVHQDTDSTIESSYGHSLPVMVQIVVPSDDTNLQSILESVQLLPDKEPEEQAPQVPKPSGDEDPHRGGRRLQQWSEVEMQEALRTVGHGKSVRSVAKESSIPHQTLVTRIKRLKLENTFGRYKPGGDLHEGRDRAMVVPPGKKPKGKRNSSWTTHQMDAAIQLCKEGHSMNHAAKMYGIPVGTLHGRVTGRVKNGGKVGCPTCLTQAEEEQLAKVLLDVVQKGFVATNEAVRKFVSERVRVDGRHHPFKDSGPGKKWWILYLQRHPKVSRKILRLWQEDKLQEDATTSGYDEQRVDRPGNILDNLEVQACASEVLAICQEQKANQILYHEPSPCVQLQTEIESDLGTMAEPGSDMAKVDIAVPSVMDQPVNSECVVEMTTSDFDANVDSIASMPTNSEPVAEMTAPSLAGQSHASVASVKPSSEEQNSEDCTDQAPQRKPWNEKDMRKALRATKKGALGVRAAARKYGIPHSTLVTRIEKLQRDNCYELLGGNSSVKPRSKRQRMVSGQSATTQSRTSSQSSSADLVQGSANNLSVAKTDDDTCANDRPMISNALLPDQTQHSVGCAMFQERRPEKRTLDSSRPVHLKSSPTCGRNTKPNMSKTRVHTSPSMSSNGISSKKLTVRKRKKIEHPDPVAILKTNSTKGLRRRRMWSETDMVKACQACRENRLTISQSARAYGIPRPTLYMRLSGKGAPGAKLGRKTYLTADEEDNLEKEILLCAKKGYTVTQTMVASFVARCLKGRKHPFKEGGPRQTWWKLFMKRHPRVEQHVVGLWQKCEVKSALSDAGESSGSK